MTADSSNVASSTNLPHTFNLLNTAETAAALRVSRSCLYAMVSRDEFARPVKIGRRSFWLASDVDAFLCARVFERLQCR